MRWLSGEIKNPTTIVKNLKISAVLGSVIRESIRIEKIWTYQLFGMMIKYTEPWMPWLKATQYFQAHIIMYEAIKWVLNKYQKINTHSTFLMI